MQDLTAIVARLPEKPGCYLFKDSAGEILYVGKAVNLRARVRSYFQSPRNLTSKVLQMVQQIADIEYITTDSEVEALILESNLIKQHRPKYNIRLRDDKQYPYLKVTLQDKWPRVVVARQVKKDGARYFGPYTSSTPMWETLKLSRRLFPLRTCNRVEAHSRPCLEYHIGRCLGPCIPDFDGREEYDQTVQDLCEFLAGKQDGLLKKLRERMEAAAEALEFERAAELRDQIRAVEKVTERQKIASPGLEDQDALALAELDGDSCVMVFFVRDGKVIGREPFVLPDTVDTPPGEVMGAFIKQFYSEGQHVPKTVLVSVMPDDAELLTQWLSARRGSRVELRRPQRGSRRELIELVAENAQQTLADRKAERERDLAATEGAVASLQEHLDLDVPPRRIECFDISNLSGQEIVAAMAVFVDGRPSKAHYRRFRIRTVTGGEPDDYRAMAEVVERRFRQGLQEQAAVQERPPAERAAAEAKAKFLPLPDLVIIDGGKGQLSAARKVMHALGIGHIPTFALAEENEWLFTEGEPDPIVLPRQSHALYLLQRIRDEAHRFGLDYLRKVHGKGMRRSVLDDVPGIGPVRKKALLKHFGSVRKLREATVEELAAAPGMTRPAAEKLKEVLGGR